MNPMRYLWHLLHSGFQCIQKQFSVIALAKLCLYRTAHNTNKNHKMSWYTELVFWCWIMYKYQTFIIFERILLSNAWMIYIYIPVLLVSSYRLTPHQRLPSPKNVLSSYKIRRILFDYRLPYIPLAQLISWRKMDWVI